MLTIRVLPTSVHTHTHTHTYIYIYMVQCFIGKCCPHATDQIRSTYVRTCNKLITQLIPIAAWNERLRSIACFTPHHDNNYCVSPCPPLQGLFLSTRWLCFVTLETTQRPSVPSVQYRHKGTETSNPYATPFHTFVCEAKCKCTADLIGELNEGQPRSCDQHDHKQLFCFVMQSQML
jgi:hypothetical protein